MNQHFNNAFRNLTNSKFYSLLTASGLSIGMAASILLFFFANFELSYDQLSPHSSNIYRVYNETYNDGRLEVKDANSHSAIGPALKESLQEVIDYTRIYTMANRALVAKIDADVFPMNKAYVVDPGFLRMFPFEKVSEGGELNKPYDVVMTAACAVRYFGTTQASGKTFEIAGGGMEGIYTVTGVLEDLPVNTHFDFDVLISYATRYSKGHQDNWDNYWDYNYIQIRADAEVEKVSQYLLEAGKKNLSSPSMVLKMQPLHDIHLKSDLTYELAPNSDIRIVKAVLIIAIAILIVAWINYINLTTARAFTRAKEVGIKKILGAGRLHLLKQFLAESIILNFIALLLALAIIQVSWPLFQNLVEKEITFNISHQGNALIIFAVFILSVISSGVYPALFLSSFHPAQSMKGVLKSGKRGILIRKSLVVLQFMVSAVMIAASYVVYQQVIHMLRVPLGISIDQTIVIQAPVSSNRQDTLFLNQMEYFRNELLSIPGVESVSSSSVIPGQNLNSIAGSSDGMWREGDSSEDRITYYFYNIDKNFFHDYEVRLLAGQHFIQQTNRRNEIIINRSALQAFGFAEPEDALHQHIVYGPQRQYRIEIIGVVDNFHIQSLKERPSPTLYYYRPITENPLISVKLSSDNKQALIQQIATHWKHTFQHEPFEYNFPDQKFKEQYHQEQRFGLLFLVFASIAVFIACLGLFGLVSFATFQRIKEIGIRKVLGAQAVQIILMLSKDFIRLIVVAAVIAAPVIWWGSIQWLAGYAYRVDMNLLMLLIPFVLIICVAMITILLTTVRAANRNPVESIRYE